MPRNSRACFGRKSFLLPSLWSYWAALWMTYVPPNAVCEQLLLHWKGLSTLRRWGFLQVALYWSWYAAAAAKSLQSCPTLCDPIDSRPPGSSTHGIFQARALEWGAIAFSGSWYSTIFFLPSSGSKWNLTSSTIIDGTAILAVNKPIIELLSNACPQVLAVGRQVLSWQNTRF